MFQEPIPLHHEQAIAFARLNMFYKNDDPKQARSIRLRAPAGTGKTHTIREWLKNLPTLTTPAVIAPTARAASALSKDGVEASTFHSLLYAPELDDDGDLIGWVKREYQEIRNAIDIFVLDEGSMTNFPMTRDIFSYNIPTVVIGDHAQLGPIHTGDDAHLYRDFNLMSDEMGGMFTHPEISLLTNRRTDPELQGITDLMLHLRSNNSIPRIYGAGLDYTTIGIVLTPYYHQQNQFDIIICATNKMRTRVNEHVRTARGYHDTRPMVGETLVCTKNNIISKVRVSNGETVTVTGRIDISDKKAWYTLEKESGDMFSCEIYDDAIFYGKPQPREKTKKEEFKQEAMFTFGYAVTCHKAQGSTFNRVLFIDENVSYFMEDSRPFRYTGVSRAAKHLTVAL